jgi:hypothetical protein
MNGNAGASPIIGRRLHPANNRTMLERLPPVRSALVLCAALLVSSTAAAAQGAGLPPRVAGEGSGVIRGRLVEAGTARARAAGSITVRRAADSGCRRRARGAPSS